MKENIALIGMKASGKRSVGIYLANLLSMRFIHLDDLIEYEYAPIPKLLELFGESGLKKYETRAIRQVAGYCDTILATGASTPLRGENMDALKDTYVIVYLKCTNKTLVERIVQNEGEEHLSEIEKRVRKASRERRALFSAYAEITVNVEGKTAEQVGDEILKKIIKLYK